MKLPNRIYDILKWVALIVLPALCVLWTSLATLWGWGYVKEVAGTIGALEVFLGALLGISCYQYNKEESNE